MASTLALLRQFKSLNADDGNMTASTPDIHTPDAGDSRPKLIYLSCLQWLVVSGIIFLLVLYWYRSQHLFIVEGVVDGDTLVIRDSGNRRLLQLAGIDAPEIHKNEIWSDRAKNYLEHRLLGQTVWIEYLDQGLTTDYKDRLLCWVTVDGHNINYELVQRGLAKVSGIINGPQCEQLIALETHARSAGLGLWSRTIHVSAPVDDSD
ncbi:MAG: hypothetical protein HJJLKODD_02184 [Phycisphaerae bacterium]|nr:hypothetical protein [Phycisphaerae bacterium]